MKRLLLLFTALAACFAIKAAQPIPYQCETMTTSTWKGYASSTPTWTNLSNTSNKPADCNATGFVRVWRASEVDGLDAWITSPEIDLKAGRTYNVSFYYVTWGDASTISSILEARSVPAQVSATNAEEMATLPAFFSLSNVTGSSKTTWNKVECTVTPSESQRFIAFRIGGDRYCKCIGLTDFSIDLAEDPSAPSAPEAATNVVATPDANDAISATLSWSLPTIDVKGNQLTEIQEVTVIRDDDTVATLPGTATSWTDSEATGLTSGNHTYSIVVKANGLTGDASTPVTIYVGPWQYHPKKLTEWSSYTTTGNSWVSFSNNLPGDLLPKDQYDSRRIWASSKISNIDSWLTSPMLDLEEGQPYRIKFRYLTWYDNETVIEHIRGHLCSSAPTADNSYDIAAGCSFWAMDNLTKGTGSTDWREVTCIVTPSEGQKFITFHVFGEYFKCIQICDFSIEKYVEKPFQPSAPTNLKATAGANHALTVTLEWTNPTRDTAGDLIPSDKQIEGTAIYRDGEYVATAEEDATSWTDDETTGLTAGDHTYAVATIVAGKESALSEEATVANVGPIQPADAANWTSDFANDTNEFDEIWSTVTNGYNSPAWTYNSSQKNIRLMNTMGYNEDSWLLTPPLMFKPGQYYTLELEAYATNPDHTLTLALADDTTQPSAVQFIVNQNELDANHTTALATSRQVHSFEFYFNPTGHYNPAAARHAIQAAEKPYHVAIHAGNAGTTGNTFIYKMQVKEVDGKTTSINTISSDENMAATTVEVFDLTGRHLGNAPTTDLDGFESGIYIMRIHKADGTIVTNKIMKQ